MTSLLESYEQQFSTLTAEIVAKTGRIPNLSGGDKNAAVNAVEKLFEESKELLEQMQLEVHEIPSAQRQKYNTRLTSYKNELTNLERDLRKARIAFQDEVRAREELLGGAEGRQSEDQRARLLENSERLERSGKKLEDGYRTCIETEQIGAQVLDDLASQRSTIQRSRDRLRETNENLGKSSRLLSAMARRIIQNRLLLVGLTVLLVLIIGLVIYFATRPS